MRVSKNFCLNLYKECVANCHLENVFVVWLQLLKKCNLQIRLMNDIVYRMMVLKPHGHYCIPILLDNKTLGVINLYIKEEHKYNQKEVEFLNSIANTLAGIIKRKNTEAEKEKLHIHLVQSDKMAAIGQLAGGVAHEINNPKGVILGFAQSVVKSIKEEDSLYMPLKSIEREAIRCKKLVGDLLTFSRVSKTEAEEIDVNSTIDVALSLVEAQTKVKNIQIIRQYGVDLPKIMANKNQIQQLIINLCNNAIDAMPETGTITISTGNVITSETKQSHIEILVKDTGSGISKEIKIKSLNHFLLQKKQEKAQD